MQRKRKEKANIIDGKDLKVGIVAAEFNSDITGKMLEGAVRVLKENNVKDSNIKIVRVPGAFEIPLACQSLAQTKQYAALIALGCVIKGQTDHYYFIAGEASRGVMEVMLKYDLPIGFGIITVNNLKQAKERAGDKSNKGVEAAEAALEMVKN